MAAGPTRPQPFSLMINRRPLWEGSVDPHIQAARRDHEGYEPNYDAIYPNPRGTRIAGLPKGIKKEEQIRFVDSVLRKATRSFEKSEAAAYARTNAQDVGETIRGSYLSEHHAAARRRRSNLNSTAPPDRRPHTVDIFLQSPRRPATDIGDRQETLEDCARATAMITRVHRVLSASAAAAAVPAFGAISSATHPLGSNSSPFVASPAATAAAAPYSPGGAKSPAAHVAAVGSRAAALAQQLMSRTAAVTAGAHPRPSIVSAVSAVGPMSLSLPPSRAAGTRWSVTSAAAAHDGPLPRLSSGSPRWGRDASAAAQRRSGADGTEDAGRYRGHGGESGSAEDAPPMSSGYLRGDGIALSLFASPPVPVNVLVVADELAARSATRAAAAAQAAAAAAARTAAGVVLLSSSASARAARGGAAADSAAPGSGGSRSAHGALRPRLDMPRHVQRQAPPHDDRAAVGGVDVGCRGAARPAGSAGADARTFRRLSQVFVGGGHDGVPFRVDVEEPLDEGTGGRGGEGGCVEGADADATPRSAAATRGRETNGQDDDNDDDDVVPTVAQGPHVILSALPHAEGVDLDDVDDGDDGGVDDDEADGEGAGRGRGRRDSARATAVPTSARVSMSGRSDGRAHAQLDASEAVDGGPLRSTTAHGMDLAPPSAPARARADNADHSPSSRTPRGAPHQAARAGAALHATRLDTTPTVAAAHVDMRPTTIGLATLPSVFAQRDTTPPRSLTQSQSLALAQTAHVGTLARSAPATPPHSAHSARPLSTVPMAPRTPARPDTVAAHPALAAAVAAVNPAFRLGSAPAPLSSYRSTAVGPVGAEQLETVADAASGGPGGAIDSCARRSAAGGASAVQGAGGAAGGAGGASAAGAGGAGAAGGAAGTAGRLAATLYVAMSDRRVSVHATHGRPDGSADPATATPTGTAATSPNQRARGALVSAAVAAEGRPPTARRSACPSTAPAPVPLVSGIAPTRPPRGTSSVNAYLRVTSVPPTVPHEVLRAMVAGDVATAQRWVDATVAQTLPTTPATNAPATGGAQSTAATPADDFSFAASGGYGHAPMYGSGGHRRSMDASAASAGPHGRGSGGVGAIAVYDTSLALSDGVHDDTRGAVRDYSHASMGEADGIPTKTTRTSAVIMARSRAADAGAARAKALEGAIEQAMGALGDAV